MYKKSILYCSVLAAAVATPLTGYALALEEVIVTATKRAEDQQDVPVAMATMTSEALTNRGVTETTDLSGSVPNLVVSSPFGRTQPNFAIRGISVANEYNANAASPIGVYINEDYKQFRPTHGMQLFDLERVEIIRGPQGTLFGRNTTGGAVSVTTKVPEIDDVGEVTGDISAKYGNYNRRGLTGAAETTLIADKLAARVAFTVNKADGYIKNKTPQTIPTALSQAGAPAAALTAFGLPTTNTVNARTDEDFASVDDQAVRLSLNFQPTDDFSAVLTATTGKSDPYGTVPIVNEAMNGGTTDVFGYNRDGLDDDEVATDGNGKNKSSADDFTLTLNWDLSDAVSVTSITGYLDGDASVEGDCDGLPIDSCYQSFNSDFDQFNQDLRFTWTGDRARLIGGIYYGEDTIKSRDDRSFYSPLADFAGIPTAGFGLIASDTSGAFPAALQAQAQAIYDALTAAGQASYPTFNPPVGTWIGSGSFIGDPTNPLPTATGWKSNNSFTQERESKAVYVEGSYDFTDKTTVTLGVRYTEDDFTLSDLRATYSDSFGNPQFNSIPFSFTPDESLVIAPLTGSSKEVTGRAIIDYAFNDDVMGFASYSRGYRAGTFNGAATQSIDQATFVNPEFVDNYELGIKSRLFDGSVQLNATLYHADYKDQQVQEVIGATTFLRNASGTLQGAEVELQWQATDDLFVSAGLGLSDSEYDDGQYFASNLNAGANCQAGPGALGGAVFASQCVDIGGNSFPFAPDVNASVYLEWTAARLQHGDVVVGLTARYQDDTWFDSFNDDKTKALPASSMMQEAYTILDGRIAFTNDEYTVALWGKNLTDKYFNAYGLDTAGPFGVDYLIRGEPRTYGLDVTYNF